MTFYLVSALFKKVTLCGAALCLASLSFLCGTETEPEQAQQAARGYTLPQSVIVPNPNAPGVQMNRWSRWRKFAYPARYRSETAPPSA